MPSFNLACGWGRTGHPIAAASLVMEKNGALVKWEYKFMVFSLTASVIHEIHEQGPFDEAQGWLNREGAEGWEVVSLVPKAAADHAWTIALMKRPKAEVPA